MDQHIWPMATHVMPIYARWHSHASREQSETFWRQKRGMEVNRNQTNCRTMHGRVEIETPNPNCYGEKAQEEAAWQYPLECFQEIAANIRRRRGIVSGREESYSKDNSYLSTTRTHANHYYFHLQLLSNISKCIFVIISVLKIISVTRT